MAVCRPTQHFVSQKARYHKSSSVNMLSVHKVNASSEMKAADYEERQKLYAFEDLSVWDQRYREHINKMMSMLLKTCRSE
ncbi:UDP-glucuronosyltransferase 1-1, variant 3 [Parelaphostrongylus tenuis]|uniref:UDP-glucuronosyltransferase 1-1, variant 3 n=1 Tax=Parelaphostrongylus tenuis TaxID=148309 RepID=A0AAD5MZU2_PARTN|nr:UDP-glucuronosyltransferase 1-1, variant 3 [Parelaphostrongylus tenuis]